MHKDQRLIDEPPATPSARRGRHKLAAQLLERGQRLRNRLSVIIGLSLGLAALLSVLD